MSISYIIDLIASAIKIIPLAFSKQVEQMLLSLLPPQKPIKDITKDTKPIITQEYTIAVCVNLNVAPDTKASILVATPRLIRHLRSRHFTVFFSGTKDSHINIRPRSKNIPKTIHFENGRIYLYNVSAPIYPITGIVPWKNPITRASLRELTTLFSPKINPCENETTRQSIPKAIANKIISIKLNFYLKQSFPGVTVIYTYLINVQFIFYDIFVHLHFFV